MLKKNFKLAVLLWFTTSFCKGQCEINFGNYSQLNQKLNSIEIEFDKEFVLISNSSPSCGSCTYIKKNTFPLDSICEFVNQHFDSYELNYSIKEQNEYALSLGMQGGPFFCILNRNGEAIHKFSKNAIDPTGFMIALKKVLSEENWLSTFEKKYRNGNYPNEMLREYSYMLYNVYQIDSIIVNQYVNNLNNSELRQYENLKFIMDMYLNFEIKCSFPYQSKAATFLRENKYLFLQNFEKDQVEGRILAGELEELQNLTKTANPEVFFNAANKLKVFEKAEYYLIKDADGTGKAVLPTEGLIFSYKEKYCIQNPNIECFNMLNSEFELENWDNHEQLNQKSLEVISKEDYNKYYSNFAEKWIVRALTLKRCYAYLDTYAQVLKANKKLVEAEKMAFEAIKNAKLENVDFSSTTELLKDIKSAKN